MPRIVDHDQRRAEIVEATWRLIARKGIEATTMREIAREAGFANGALAPYFGGKQDILGASFRHVFNATNLRYESVSTDRGLGLSGLRLFCLEIMPLDEERLLEARIVIPFWESAATDLSTGELYWELMTEWRNQVLEHLRAAENVGEISAGLASAETVDQLLSILNGVQVLAVLSPLLYPAERQVAMLDGFLERLRTP